ncbi:hypothetical protein EJ08DRAFT_592144, partial [Tothia fuscella]
NQAVVLRLTKERKVWNALIVGMVLSDLGHIYALWEADKLGFFDVSGFRREDWINEGMLVVGLALRVGFLAGVGVECEHDGGGKRD